MKKKILSLLFLVIPFLSFAQNGGIDIDAALKVDVDASGIELDSDVASNFTVDNANLTLSTTNSGNIIINAFDLVDIDATGGITIDENSGGHIGITTAGQVDIDSASGQIVEITSDTEIDLTATDIDMNGDADVSGTFTMGSLVLPTITAADPADSPTAGTARFRTDTDTLWIYNGAAWKSVTLT